MKKEIVLLNLMTKKFFLLWKIRASQNYFSSSKVGILSQPRGAEGLTESQSFLNLPWSQWCWRDPRCKKNARSYVIPFRKRLDESVRKMLGVKIFGWKKRQTSCFLKISKINRISHIWRISKIGKIISFLILTQVKMQSAKSCHFLLQLKTK